MPTKPLTKPRAVLYLRQSTYREESISLELQEFETRRHAEAMGYEVVATETDPGRTGRSFDRPGIQRVMKMAEAKEVERIILWKWSRFSRNRYDWPAARKVVEQAGAQIESATEPNDLETPEGRLMMDQLIAFAAYESDRIGKTWKEAHARRLRKGLPHSGGPRFGYTFDTDQQRYIADPETAPILREAYERFVAGETVIGLCRWLTDTGAKPVPGGRVAEATADVWKRTTLRGMLDSGFAAGRILYNGDLLPGSQERLLNEDEWEAYLAARARRSKHGERERTRDDRRDYLLSGIAVCGHCGGKMVGTAATPTVHQYRCNGGLAKRHSGGSVYGPTAENAVMEWLRSQADLVNASAAAEQASHPARIKPSRAITIEAEIAKLRHRLEAALEYLTDGTVDAETYRRSTTKWETQIAELEIDLREARVDDRVVPERLTPQLLEQWDRLTVRERRELLRKLIDRVVVTSGKPRAAVEIIAR